MPSMTDAARIKRIRRLARRNRQRVWKVREDSPDAQRYGPFAIVRLGTSRPVAWGMDLDGLEEWYGLSPVREEKETATA